jgi:hypothetical protein
MNYDSWKQQEPPSELENNCAYCGEPCEVRYCSRECKKADELDN